MLSNIHTHTIFCDGKNTCEEIILSAIDKGFASIGFSGHGYTDHDINYCMRDTELYRKEVLELKQKYASKIQVYLGVEEDAFGYVARGDFEYIIGSCHYLKKADKYYEIDGSYDGFKECIDAFDGDVLALATSYYEAFTHYILKRKPDVVGHFDLITKYDEMDKSLFLDNNQYIELAKKYLSKAMQSDCIFEVNTGAISRGYRSTPYPSEELLHLLCKNNGKIILSSDSHNKDTLDYYFIEAKELLSYIGFEFMYVLYDNEFKKINIK